MAHEWSHGHCLLERVDDARRREGKEILWRRRRLDLRRDGNADGAYWVAKVGNAYVGGLFTLTNPQFDGIHERWMSCLAIDDVDGRTNTDAFNPRSRCRRHRHPDRARRRRHQLDDSGKNLIASGE
jgi:hypothetical protein